MSLFSSILLTVESIGESNKGGLFDFNATLPLMVLQFLVLMTILNFIFYKPVIKILDERDDYIRTSLTTASTNLLEANSLASSYEDQLAEARKTAQFTIETAKKEAQELVSTKLQIAQKEAEQLIADASRQLNLQKEQALKTLESQVDTLSDQIKSKLMIP
uniref:ATP synthase CFO B' subunit subunit II n=1 Tax=Pulvinaster venetus TaxID=427767 RepID=UPI001FCDAB19|nr:ATP synthase CFO B' subunit subunit II [Pulvinaster venetus]UNJ17003.1 ATP synthase CFO B' subunit subunit II [Pulvinaster venetus]